ncbi:hypothetical protein FM037_03140 [Shewanella psychropiezotolerans]|uniref:Uncharacterized protein n=1 Tax=Shewanella psychropiezotolerans TaxID=2593655 RepID=A0ABX5WTJ9_9GAMM|nr:hypothetical protein [Shewanella psychropiezotolerans]QDO82422.1 hypothetical protein FM037_03140 [Shewanella psychropiezotolerans]
MRALLSKVILAFVLMYITYDFIQTYLKLINLKIIFDHLVLSWLVVLTAKMDKTTASPYPIGIHDLMRMSMSINSSVPFTPDSQFRD